MKTALVILFLLVLVNCRNQNRSVNNSSLVDTLVKIENSPAGNSIKPGDTMYVNESCVVFFFPDSIELAKMQTENDEDAYSEMVSDLTWYPGIAGAVLDSFQIKNIFCDKKFLHLTNSTQQNFIFKRKDSKGDMILFNVKKKPVLSASTEFNKDSVLGYFDK